jgi:hypothetical protein
VGQHYAYVVKLLLGRSSLQNRVDPLGQVFNVLKGIIGLRQDCHLGFNELGSADKDDGHNEAAMSENGDTTRVDASDSLDVFVSLEKADD